MDVGADAEWVALGVVTRPQGVRGQLRVKLYNPESELLLSVGEAHFRQDAQLRLVRFREPPKVHQGDLLIWPVDSNDRDQAEARRGTEICVRASELPPLEEGEYYHRDLIGMAVRDREGNEVGTVLRIDTYPTVDVAVVKTRRGNLDVPILDPYWVDVDLGGRCVTVDHLADLQEHVNAKV